MSGQRGRLVDGLAQSIAPVVLRNITTQYPYHDAHVYRTIRERFDPVSAHPAFANSFDWHSSVHSHWTALQLLAHFERIGAEPPGGQALRQAVARNLMPQNIAVEAEYLRANPTYERPYGWAWALRLAAACESLGLEATSTARPALQMLAGQIADAVMRWLTALPAPVRTGVHGNTAFALGLILDACRELELRQVEAAIVAFVKRWYQPDRDYPAKWERSGYDFLSPGLAEADLVRRVIHGEQFVDWWRGFLPSLDEKSATVEIAEVPDVADGHVVHLHGLNLSRAGMLARLAGALKDAAGDLDHQWYVAQARSLYAVGLDQVAGADYLSTHWLPTFAWDAACSLDALD